MGVTIAESVFIMPYLPSIKLAITAVCIEQSPNTKPVL